MSLYLSHGIYLRPRTNLITLICMNFFNERYVSVLTDKAHALNTLGLKEQAEEAYSKAKQYKSQ